MKRPRASLFSGLVAAIYLASVGTPSAQQRTTAALTLQDVIQRAVATAAAFEREFAAVVADEYFVQQNSIIAIVKSVSRREMRSDFLLVRVPGRDGWLPFRDVYEVDGRAEERARPTIVRTQPVRGDDVPIEGSLWIEPGAGRVIKTLVKTAGTPDPGMLGGFGDARPSITMMRVETTFTPNRELGLSVPERMTEWARAEDGSSIVEGTAIYSKFRRFTVKTAETFQESR